jgi:hypothetical protein
MISCSRPSSKQLRRKMKEGQVCVIIIQYSHGIAKRPLAIFVCTSRDSSLYANTKIKTHPYVKGCHKRSEKVIQANRPPSTCIDYTGVLLFTLEPESWPADQAQERDRFLDSRIRYHRCSHIAIFSWLVSYQAANFSFPYRIIATSPCFPGSHHHCCAVAMGQWMQKYLLHHRVGHPVLPVWALSLCLAQRGMSPFHCRPSHFAWLP